MSLLNLKIVNVQGVISTDDIIPAIYKHKYTDPRQLANHIFENKFPDLVKLIHSGSVLISDSTFGIGSSREQAVSALLAAGVEAIIAPNFGRIFYRNCWNLGLVAIELNLSTYDDISENRSNGTVSINLNDSQCIILDKEVSFPKIPPELIKTYLVGGLLNYISGKNKNSENLSTQAFNGLAKNYEAARPSYPNAVYMKIISFWKEKNFLDYDPWFVDVGSGTGISTRAMFNAFSGQCHAIGIEPGADMILEARERSNQSLAYLNGTAEAMPLQNNTIDIVTAAQAAQWFNRPLFYKEVKRVLKPGGVVAIYENNRDWESSEFLNAYENFLETYSIDQESGKKYSRYYRDFPYEDELEKEFGSMLTHTIQWSRQMTTEDFLLMAKSSTQAQRAINYLGETEAQALILETADKYKDASGLLLLKYNVKIYLARSQ